MALKKTDKTVAEQHGTPTALSHCNRCWGRPFGMGRSEQYWRFAAECMEMASTVENERSRAALIHMAQVWLRLAEAIKPDEETDDC